MQSARPCSTASPKLDRLRSIDRSTALYVDRVSVSASLETNWACHEVSVTTPEMEWGTETSEEVIKEETAAARALAPNARGREMQSAKGTAQRSIDEIIDGGWRAGQVSAEPRKVRTAQHRAGPGQHHGRRTVVCRAGQMRPTGGEAEHELSMQ
ncbi:unnamed protein product [Calypogeia fissa]